MEHHHSDSAHGSACTSISTDTSGTIVVPDVKHKQLTLVEAAKLTGVSYFTLDYANRHGRLPVTLNAAGLRVVSAFVLAQYMTKRVSRKYRWKAKWVPIDQIAVRSTLQPRDDPFDLELISRIEKDLADGGTTDPVWIIMVGEKAILVDGARRMIAHQRLNRPKIEAITLRLPFRFAKAIAREANMKHGENLTKLEQRQIVRDYFAANPTILDVLDRSRGRDGKRTQIKGAMSQRKLEEKLGISLSTINRVVDELRPLPATTTKTNPVKVLTDIGSILAKNPPARQTPLQLKVQTVVAFRALKALDAKLTKRDRKNVNRYLRNDQGSLCRSLTPRLRDLLARRARQSGKKGGR
jgi:transposase